MVNNTKLIIIDTFTAFIYIHIMLGMHAGVGACKRLITIRRVGLYHYVQVRNRVVEGGQSASEQNMAHLFKPLQPVIRRPVV
jgi:hypothetical protein